MTRQHAERAFHEEQARRRWETLAAGPEALRVDADAYLDHETWLRPAFALLGDVAGRRVLDFGCGHGMAGVLLAERGAQVVGFDLAGGYVAEAAARSAVHRLTQRWAGVQAAGERLPFADRSFDRVWAHAILHHLDLPTAAAELRRVLRPGGWVVAAEPWGGNPLVAWARRRCAYPDKERSADEEPLRAADLAVLRRCFRLVEVHPFQLLGMLRRRWPSLPGRRWLDRVDAALLHRVPGLGQWSRYVVLKLLP
ncbi:MAG TPA: class I SAM-dependent methyltransferase [Gemmatales bacterium]|nr:class I SAM-dependent methyltransferase [Gemmatales bacterium]HMP58981.1 class I SAM-dependent methyltransferase [Gemmatales bacterium]